MNNEELYYEAISPLINSGLAREVFVSENISILNLADAWYLVSLKNPNEKRKKYVVGFLANYKALEVISEDERNYNMVVERLGEDMNAVIVNSKLVNKVMQAQEITMRDGPSNFINHELEEEIALRNKNERGRR